MSGRKLARRACDGCKIRKIKCSESSPCDGCRNANIPCTWLKQAQPRGPRRLRDATLQEIRKAQEILQSQSREAARRGTTRSPNVTDPDPPPRPSSEVAQLVLYLCVYRVQLYPIWPVIKVERLIASLQSESPDIEVFALAYALAAATASRTKSTDLSISNRNHAQILEAKCQAARARVPQDRPPNLTTVRIAYFLHVYHESLEVNSMKSMLYLREAVTIATMIGLHKETYYLDVPAQEVEIRRRVLWLLFVTERVIAILFEQPITLRARIELPSIADTDEVDVLMGFQQLVKLFWKLDDAGMFSVLDELESTGSPASADFQRPSSSLRDYTDLIVADTDHRGYICAVQKLNLLTTRCWMQVMNVRIQQSSFGASTASFEQNLLPLISLVEGTINMIEASPYTLLEAHGSAFQLKLSTISSVLRDSHSWQSNSLDGHELRLKCADAGGRLYQVVDGKLRSATTQYPTVSHIARQYSSQTGTAMSSPHRQLSTSSYKSKSPSPGVSSLPPYLSQDFAISNNYDGLFEAVELSGVRSSDSVEDLFSQTTLEQYNTFDESWPAMNNVNLDSHNTDFWQAQQGQFSAE